MGLQIRRGRDDDAEALVGLSLLAWAPVFVSFERILGAAIYAKIYPDWKAGQRAAVVEVCRGSEKTVVLVAELDGAIAGFIAYGVNREDASAEVQLLAVHPDAQRRGIGTEPNNAARREMTAGGMRLAVAATGGDPSHAPARRSYEKAGYRALPLARYYTEL